MKLRSLELTNVRRFGSKTAVLGPFGDGLTTITAGNERGKSTFFDALHALLFISHTSKSDAVKGLQPYSGGQVGIAAVIDLEGREYRLEKTFLQRAAAKVTDVASGQVLHQAGEAESWIEEKILHANKGPAGLLWVRQGEVHIDPQGRGKDAENIAVRRDLMSSVRGQIDAVTGGRRMDRIVERARKEFDLLSTKAMKPKSGSRWKEAEDKVAELTERRDKLVRDVKELVDALGEKRQVKDRLRILQNAGRQSERAAEIVEAKEALEEAGRHNQRVKEAESAVLLLAAERAGLERDIEDIETLQRSRADLAEELAGKATDLKSASEEKARTEAVRDKTRDGLRVLEDERRVLMRDLGLAREAERDRQKWMRLRALFEISGKLKDPRDKLKQARSVLKGRKIEPDDIERLDDLRRRISIARQQARVHFSSFIVDATARGQVKVEGRAIDAGREHLIDRPLDLEIDGFGKIELRPGEAATQGIEDPEKLSEELSDFLSELGFETVEAARQALAALQAAEKDELVASAEIRGLAPEGEAALEAEWMGLCKDLGHPVNGEPSKASASVPDGQVASDLEKRIADLEAKVELARDRVEVDRVTATEAASEEARVKGVLDHLSELQANLLVPDDEDVRLAELLGKRNALLDKGNAASLDLEALRSGAPALDAAQSRHDRLTGAAEADRQEVFRLEKDLARVNGAIEARSEASVEEKLAEVEAQLARAQDRSIRYEMEARAWDMLIRHLENAREAAQETYFEPIRKELAPLLAQIHDGAQFDLDPDSMLVGRIVRDGVTDDVDVLSGGAYEQIAILTRLAFAKLFARQGRHVPVILDDALVHTDDERISTMFDMLSQVAREQQVIVFSCRTKAFDDLGGTRARIEMAEA